MHLILMLFLLNEFPCTFTFSLVTCDEVIFITSYNVSEYLLSIKHVRQECYVIVDSAERLPSLLEPTWNSRNTGFHTENAYHKWTFVEPDSIFIALSQSTTSSWVILPYLTLLLVYNISGTATFIEIWFAHHLSTANVFTFPCCL